MQLLYSKKRMILFYCANALLYLASGFAHPVTPTLFQDLHLQNYMFGYALAAMMATYFLFSPFWGELNNFISSRVILLICCFGYSVGQIFFLRARTEMQFIWARVFAGAFLCGIFVVIMNYIVHTSPDETQRSVRLTTNATLQSVSSAFGFFVGGMIGSIKTEYAIIAQITLLALCGVFFFLVCENDAKTPIKELKFSSVVKKANPFAAFMSSGQFLTPLLAVLFVVCALHNLGSTGFDQTFNYYIKDQFQFSSAYNGALKAAMGLITLIANSTICVYFIKKTNVKKSAFGMLALCSATMLWILFINQITLFLGVNVFFFAFASVCHPLLQSIVASNAKGGNSNLVMGFYNAVRGLGGVFGAAASGGLYMFNPKYPFVCCLIAFLLAAALAFLYYRGSLKKEKADALL